MCCHLCILNFTQPLGATVPCIQKSLQKSKEFQVIIHCFIKLDEKLLVNGPTMMLMQNHSDYPYFSRACTYLTIYECHRIVKFDNNQICLYRPMLFCSWYEALLSFRVPHPQHAKQPIIQAYIILTIYMVMIYCYLPQIA